MERDSSFENFEDFVNAANIPKAKNLEHSDAIYHPAIESKPTFKERIFKILGVNKKGFYLLISTLCFFLVLLLVLIIIASLYAELRKIKTEPHSFINENNASFQESERFVLRPPIPVTPSSTIDKKNIEELITPVNSTRQDVDAASAATETIIASTTTTTTTQINHNKKIQNNPSAQD